MVRQLIIRTALWLAGMAALLFIPAGTVNWPAGWAFLLAVAVWAFAIGCWLARHDPQLLAERMAPLHQRGQKHWDKILISCAVLLWTAWLTFMSLDAVRFRWSHVPA
ncbi:MAG: isoprenylcysteine carboxylmethyltransferase family protein, partial [Burkholderiales bacterium]